jgi:hypothetical protein
LKAAACESGIKPPKFLPFPGMDKFALGWFIAPC